MKEQLSVSEKKPLIKEDNLDKPQLRFPEFSLNWNLKKIKDISNVTGGGTPKTDISEYWDGNINWFTPSEIGNKYVYESNRKISEKGLKNSSAKILPENTILLSSRATIGELSISKNIATTNQGFQSLIVKDNYNHEFIYYLIQLLKKDMIRLSSGSTFLEISKKEIEKIPIFIPSLDEQNKIANFLSLVDKKIELLEKKHKNIEKYKKFLLQNFFSSNLNFDEKNNKRDECYLKDISSMKYGNLPDKNKITDDTEKYPIYSGFRVLGYYEEFNIEKGDLIVTARGSGVGQAKLITTNSFLTNLSIGLKIDNTHVLNEYLYYYFQKNSLKYLDSGSAQPQIIIKDLMKVKVNFPSIIEQRKIVNSLNYVDTILSNINNQIKFIKLFKKGLLQQMFV